MCMQHILPLRKLEDNATLSDGKISGVQIGLPSLLYFWIQMEPEVGCLAQQEAGIEKRKCIYKECMKRPKIQILTSSRPARE